ncbi:MAG: EamA family transporter [Clostridia bacterium]|nr:EamA family transporter [Clostridia bacterium]
MYIWLLMALASGILLGFCDIFKKKALERVEVLNVLAVYSLFCFIAVSFEFNNALNITHKGIFLVLLKTLIMFFNWILGFIAIRNMPISIITPFGTLNPLFSILLGVLVLKERLSLPQILGISIILISYYFISKSSSSEVKGLFKNKFFYLMVGSTLLSAISALIDKIALREINTGQLQFWFYLIITLLYFVAMILNRYRQKEKNTEPIRINFYMILMSIFLVLSDRLYFNAINMPLGLISIILPLRRISVLISAIVGGMIFKEKNLKSKFLCICLLLVGIAIIFVGK